MTKRKLISQGVRFNVLRRDNFACRYCGQGSPAVVLHLDHVKPHSAGGEDTEANLITACEACNYGKGAKTDVAPPVVSVGEKTADDGFVGFFGHTHRGREIEFQFQVIRRVGADRYAVQLFSWFDGRPTEIQVWDGGRLSEPTTRFYQDRDEWVSAADRGQKLQLAALKSRTSDLQAEGV